MSEDPSVQKPYAEEAEEVASLPTTKDPAQPAGGDDAAVAQIPASEKAPGTAVADEKASR
jgi:hypothetical protein